MKKFLVLLIILVIIIVGIVFWWQTNIAPVNVANKSQKIFVISQGESIRTVGANLQQAGFIKSSIAFFILVKLQKYDNKIQAGDFRLSPSESLLTLAQNLTHGSLDYWITIPEGKRASEIAAILKEKATNYDQSWNNKLVDNEGYLFPDSYLVPTNDGITNIIAFMRKNFDDKFATINNVAADVSQNKIVIVASLVEREAKFSEDRSLVASVIYNRLKANMPLQLDATIQYALGYDQIDHTWWKNNLTEDDLNIDSPYNTRLNTGLPPTPICNPGLSSLTAAANPAHTDYIYYVSDSTGHLHFAKTLDEHTANIQKYHVQ